MKSQIARSEIRDAQNMVEGLLAHGTSELDYIKSCGGNPWDAAQNLADYAEEQGQTIDAGLVGRYFQTLITEE